MDAEEYFKKNEIRFTIECDKFFAPKIKKQGNKNKNGKKQRKKILQG